MLALAAAALVVRLSLDLRSGGLLFVTGAFGLFALVVVGVALVLVRPGWIGPALGMLAALYVGHVLVAGMSDLTTLVLVSVALLLVGELSQWSFDSRLAGRYEVGVHRSRALAIASLGAAGLATVLLAALTLGVPILDGSWRSLLAIAASVAVLGLIAGVATRSVNRGEMNLEGPEWR